MSKVRGGRVKTNQMAQTVKNCVISDPLKGRSNPLVHIFLFIIAIQPVNSMTVTCNMRLDSEGISKCRQTSL